MRGQIIFKNRLFWLILIGLILIGFGIKTGNLGLAQEQKKEDKVFEKKEAGINLARNFGELEKLILKANLKNLKLKSKEIEQNYQQVIEGLKETRKYLEEKKIDSKILERLDKFQKEYQESIGKTVNNLSKAKTVRNFQAQLSLIKDFNKKNQEVSREQIKNLKPFKTTDEGKVITKRTPAAELSPEKSEYLEIKKIEIKKNKSQQESSSFQNNSGDAALPVFAGLSGTPSDYLGETEEIGFTQSIKDLADSLAKDPLKILNYVRSNIDYVFYYGLKKGADATLIEKAGNDFDQASLLLALLRYSGYPARYKHGQVKLSLNQVMNLLGVDDPFVAAKLFSQTHIPYVLYTDSVGNPLFFILEHVWVEAWITYDYTRGINQDSNPTNKMWVPMEPSLKTIYYSQLIDIIQEMNFDASSFYENYLQGNYGQTKPLTAFRQQIENYLTSYRPDLTYEDILTKAYRQTSNLEFIPNTLPFEIVEIFGEYSQAPENLKHKIQFRITDKETGLELLNYTAKIHNIADKQLVLTYVAASPEDQQVIDQYLSIYDIVPLSLVHMKPVIKVQGQIMAGGSAASPEVMLGKKEELTIKFLIPSKESGLLIEEEKDRVEKEVIAGNDEGIAINTDRIVASESRPSQDTQTSEYLSSQKLYRTAVNYLDRLQKSHQELAQILGADFTNVATRAVVFNGIEITYQAGQPYSFSWKGLRIDSSAKLNYFSHFGNDIKRNRKIFMYLFGLSGSLDESAIFEEDFGIESISTVKGLRMLNQGQVTGVSAIKITSANRSAIEELEVSAETKRKFRNSVDAGNIIYTASKPFAEGNFAGLLYIDLEPNTGNAGYIIGEGLNGGYTVEQWQDGWQNFWRTRLIENLTATIITPTSNQQFTQGDAIPWKANYQGTVLTIPVQWTEEKNLDTSGWKTGNNILRTGYGTTANINVVINKKPTFGKENQHTEFDDIIIEKANKYGVPSALIKAVIFEESSFDKNKYRYEAHTDYDWYSGPDPGDRIFIHPNHHFTIAGRDTRNRTIPKGNQLPLNYLTIAKENSLIPLDVTDSNGDGNLTASELVANNPKQNWSGRPSWDFTSQLALSASYGLMQLMYETARWNGFDDTSEGQNAQEIYKLFDANVSIEIGSRYLKYLYENNSYNWFNALRGWNSKAGYAEYVYNIYQSGIFNQQ